MKYLTFFLLLVCVGCAPSNRNEDTPAVSRIFYLNSYHKGYQSSDDIRRGFDEAMQGKNVEVKTFYMDTKRIDAEAIPAKAKDALGHIKAFDPDVIVVSDDNAVFHVVVPYLEDGGAPVLFTGVNWSSEQYGLPDSQVSGILEILPIEAALDTLQNYYPDMQTIAVLSEASASERKNVEVIRPLLEQRGLRVMYELVEDFESWKGNFVRLNKAADVLFLPTNGSVKNWKEQEAADFVKENISKPVFTCDDFMMRYAVFGLTKRPQEMGKWAAEQAIKILNGTDVSTIPISENQDFEAWINTSLAREVGFEPRPALLKTLKEYETP